MSVNAGRVTIITVTHNGAAVIGSMVESIPAELPLIVIDNASKDNTLSIIEQIRPDAMILQNAVGLGYGNAMNIGLRNVATEFALLTNPDTIISEEAIDLLVETALTFQDAGLVGPKVLTPAGEVEPSFDVELHKRKDYGKRGGETLPEGPVCVDSLSGAVVLARMQCLRDIGFFDPAYFLYFEDEDMCMTIRRNQHSLIFDPKAVISHFGGGSVPATTSYHWEKFWHMSWSRLYYERKHRGLFSALGVFIREMPKFALKALGYGLILKPEKSRRDAARCLGMIAYMVGIRASRADKLGE